MLKGNAIVGQSGGPTAVINASLAGVMDGARVSKTIAKLFGMRFAAEGLLAGNLLDLSKVSATTTKKLIRTPSSVLGSSRLKLKDEHFQPILANLKKHNIRYFFMIGGNDTMDTIHRVVAYANQAGYAMLGVGICKTVDNDLAGTDHTPGYPSAARYVALSVLQGGRLARDMQRVDQFVILQTVGRSAGWLPAAGALARTVPADAPHIILMPERKFDDGPFLAKVQETQKKYGFVSIVCGEGITWADGTPVSASQTRDKFNNVEFGAMGGTSAAMMLHRMISNKFGWRGEFQVTESLLMCGDDRGVKLDYHEAYGCGRQAVRLAQNGQGQVMVTIQRLSKPGQPYRSRFDAIPLAAVANEAKPMPDKYISKDGFGVTKAFLDYVRPLVGPLPQYADLGK